LSEKEAEVIYLLGEGSSNKPGLKITSTVAFTDLSALAEEACNRYLNFAARRNVTYGIRKYIEKFNSLKVYKLQLNTGKKPGRCMTGRKVWELLNSDEEAKRQLMKTMLRE
jgi:hypothetical protein